MRLFITIAYMVLTLASGLGFESNFESNESYVENIGNVEQELVDKFNNSYMLIQDNVRERFEKDGWTVYTKDLEKGYLAYTIINEKAIYIDNREKAEKSIIHEIGHYIDYKYSFISESKEFNRIFNNESEKFKKIHKTHKNNTSTAVEYFAEAYMVIVEQPDLMMINCPETYGFIKTCADNLK